MAVYTLYSFTNDTGARTEVINATEMNSNFNWAQAAIPPIGSIIPFYDFNAGLTFNTDYWAYCDGSSKTVGALGAQTLPDLSNRYLVGFGTEGGGDMDSAAWATAAVGNASHQIDIQHNHTNTAESTHTHGVGTFAGPSHTHTGTSHTHAVNITSFTSGAGSAHSHGVGTYKFKTLLGDYNAGAQSWLYGYDSGGTQKGIAHDNLVSTTSENYRFVQFNAELEGAKYTKDGSGTSANESSHTHAVDPPNTTSAAGGTGATGAGGTGAVTGTSAAGSSHNHTMNNQLSATQSIQPRSIRVRFIMRIL